MTNTVYDAGIGPLISGYPSAIVDRGTSINPTAIENDFFQRILIAPKAFITNGAIYDAATNTLKVSVKQIFKKVFLVIKD